MKAKSEISKIKSPILFCILSFVAGGMNGFLGTGGGIVMIYILGALTKNDKKDNFATTLCAMIPATIISLIAYSKSGNIDTGMIKTLALPAIIGGILGAFLTDKIKTEYLTICFSALVIYSGIYMVMK